MDLQMEPHLSGIFLKYIQHPAGAFSVVVECPVQHPHILYSVRIYVFQPVSDLFETLISDRLLTSAHAEGTCVETAPGGLQLHKRLVPIEETAFLRISQRRKILHPCSTVVVVGPAAVAILCLGYPAQPTDRLPPRLIPYCPEPLRQGLLSLAPDHGAHKSIPPEEILIIPKKLRPSAHNPHSLQQRRHPREHLQLHIMRKKPKSRRDNIWLKLRHLRSQRPRIVIDSPAHHTPLPPLGLLLHLSMNGRQSHRRMRIRTVYVQPENLHDCAILRMFGGICKGNI